MDRSATNITRRDLVAVAGLGAMAAAGLVGQAAAAPLTDVEKANVELVDTFCKLWGVGAAELDAIMGHMTDDCIFKVGAITTVAGRAAVSDQFKTYFAGGTRYEMKILETFAKGPVVVNSRIDTTVKPEKVNPPGPVVGVFIIAGGKIREWGEYPYKPG